jgi:hypothetical protein
MAAPANQASSYATMVGRFELSTLRHRNAEERSLDPVTGPA